MRLPFVHPSDRALGRFADDGRGPARIHAHLARCATCREVIADRRALREAARALPTPEPSPDLLARVLAERAAGRRMILPVDPPATPRTSTVRVAVAAAAAVLVVAAGSLLWRTTTTRTTHAAAGARELDALAAIGFFASVADAAEVPRGSYPSVAPVSGIDGRRLRAGRFRFARRWTDGAGRVTEDGRGSVDIASVTHDGQAAWRLVHEWRFDTPGRWGERADVETLYVARADLRPLARLEHVAPYSRYAAIDIAQRFAGDSVLGRMHAHGADATPAGRPIAQRLPSAFAPYLTDALSSFLLSTVRVGPGWQGSVSMLGWAVRPNDLFVPLTLRVDGSERITVPAGTFDCWKITITAGGRAYGYWVRKSDGIGVLSRDATHRDARGVRDIVLVSAAFE